jgi:CBS-domain-containing membrane protein
MNTAVVVPDGSVMHQPKVHDVMTNEVLTMAAAAHPAELVKIMTAQDVSALAIADRFDQVTGVVTRSDILKALVWRQPKRRGLPFRRGRKASLTWRHQTAREIMSAPAVTVAPDESLGHAGRLMHHAGVKRLLVVDHRRHLLGIVAAADLLKVFARSDEDVETSVRTALNRLTTGSITAHVEDGVVTLTGRVSEPTTAGIARDLALAEQGVAAVINELRVEPDVAGPASETSDTAGAGSADGSDQQSTASMDEWWTSRRGDDTSEAPRVPPTS